MGCNLRDLASPVPIQMNDLAGERVAVDAFLTAYQFITSLRARGEGKDAATEEAAGCRRQTPKAGGVGPRRPRCRDRRAQV